MPDAYGFFTSTCDDVCGLCLGEGKHWTAARISPGDTVRRMPAQWQPKRRQRLAHAGCVLVLVDKIEADTGVHVTLERVVR